MLKTLLFLLSPILIYSQLKITVLDSDNNTPISNAIIFYKNKEITQTNELGEAIIDKKYDIVQIKLSGYESKEIFVDKANSIVYITKNENALNEIKVKKVIDYAAINLIKEVIRRQKENHPNQLDSYKFYGYNKFTADENPDSIQLVLNPKTKQDSLHNNNKKILDRSMNFIAERVTEYKYLQGYGEKNTLIANKISGIKTPLYEFAALQPVSMYLDDDFSYFIMKLPNPISQTGLNTYRYKINDTIKYNNKPTIELRYFSKKKDNEIKKLLDGYVYIDLKSKAITKFFGERVRKKTKTFIEINWEEKREKWFPTSQFFKVLSDGGMPKRPKKDSITPEKKIIKGTTNYNPSWIYYNTYFSQPETPIILDKKEFKGYENNIAKSAYDKADELLKNYRINPLTPREMQTYVVVDSMGKAEKINKNIVLLRILTRGVLEYGKFNLKPFDLFQANGYEGFRTQLSAETNYKFSDTYVLNGYLAYGFKDEKIKGSIGGKVYVNKPYSGNIFIKYTNDVGPAGREINKLSENSKYNTLSLKNLYNDVYFSYNKGELGYQQDFLKNITATFSLDYSQDQSKFNYAFLNQNINNKYQTLNTHINVKWAPFAKYMRTPLGKITIEDKPAYFYLNYTKSWETSFSDFNFNKIEFKGIYGIKNPIGYSNIIVKAGYLYGDTSLIYNFEGNGFAKNGNDFWSKLSVANNGFETMIPGEFFSDKYFSVSVFHQFPSISLGKSLIPIQIQYKNLYGEMQNTGLHTFYSFKTPNKYYQELGIEVNHLIYKSIGVGAYYRLGAYNLGDFNKNFYFKFTFSIPQINFN